MDHQALKFPSRLLAVALVALCATSALADGLGRAREARFRSTRPLPQDKQAAVDLVVQALEPIGVAEIDRDAGEVVSKEYRHTVGKSKFRTRVTAVVTRRAEGTVVEVKAQRAMLMDTLSPGVFTPSPRWQPVGEHEAIAEDIIQRIERAAGVWIDPEQEAIQEAAARAVEAAGGGTRAGAPGGAAVVGASAWREIERLKEERRDLLGPIQALDEQALEIVYSGDAASRSRELDEIRTERNRLWEKVRPRLMELDRRILELVLEE